MNVLMVYPTTPDTFWSFSHVLPFISRKAAYPPLGLLTIGAMLPHDWNLHLVDLNVSRLGNADIDWADYVMISGMIVHAESARQIAVAAPNAAEPSSPAARSSPPATSASPKSSTSCWAKPRKLMPQVVADMLAGTLKPIYEATRARRHPVADPALGPDPTCDDYATMPLQFSRGCPFNCEFCDIIVMNGRVPRTKTARTR